MPEQLNLWGKEGCKLPNGGLCTSCCHFFSIEEFDSPPGALCQYAVSGKGCSLVNNTSELGELRNSRCGPYHCSWDQSHWGSFALIAYHQGQVAWNDLQRLNL